jgi:NTP pyrophosphatase (non-canonical NTP hydrolase)
MEFQELQKIAHKIATDKGFWESKRNGGELIALAHSELSEALEAMRTNNWTGKGGVAEELSDCVIRIMDMAEAWHIDLDSEIIKKMETNKRRPRKHGKEF